MMTQVPDWSCPGSSRGGGGRPIAPASGTLLAVLILLAVLPSAAAVSSSGADAAALATLVEAAQASRGEVLERRGELGGLERRSGWREHACPESPVRLDAGVVAWVPSWGGLMASRGLGAMPPPVV